MVVFVLFLTACSANEAQLVQKGNEAYAAQQYDEALGAYTDAQEIAPDLAQPIYNTANTLYRQEGLAEAQQMMQQAIPQAQGELAQFSQYNLGNFYFEQQNFAAAIEAYKEALRLDPNDQEAKHNLELALQQQQDQQQQQQNQNQNQEQQDQNQETADSSSSSDNGDSQDRQSQSGADNEQEQSGDNGSETADSTDANSGTASTSTGGLSAEQARQLLGAIGQNTETLQEHLQQIYVAPGGSLQKDW